MSQVGFNRSVINACIIQIYRQHPLPQLVITLETKDTWIYLKNVQDFFTSTRTVDRFTKNFFLEIEKVDSKFYGGLPN